MSTSRKSLQDIDFGMRRERIVQYFSLAGALSVDEDDDVLAQLALLVEHVAAQPWVVGEGGVEGAAQIGRAGLHLRHGHEAAQLLGKNKLHHRYACWFDRRNSDSMLNRIKGKRIN